MKRFIAWLAARVSLTAVLMMLMIIGVALSATGDSHLANGLLAAVAAAEQPDFSGAAAYDTKFSR